MAHSYRKDGPVVDSFTFNPNTRIMTIGDVTYTFPATGTDFAALITDVASLTSTLGLIVTGKGITLPTVDPADGSFWNDAGTVKVSEIPPP